MSYILEALKKLEQKRQEEEAPNLLTPQRNTAPVRKKRTFWPYFVSGILLLNVILVGLLFWIGPLKKSMLTPPPQPQVARESAQPPQTSTPPAKKEEPIVEAMKDSPATKQKDVTQSPPVKASPPAPMKVIPEATQSRTMDVQPTLPIKPGAEPLPREVKPGKPVKPSTKVVSIKDLPGDVRSKLPELKMTVHSYNDQAHSRFIVINNSTAREGQFVHGDLKLEQITPNGIILNYQGHRFSLGINENP